MISNLLQNLQQGYGLGSVPITNPAKLSNTYGMPGLLGTAGIPMAGTSLGMRTPDYISLLGRFGQQPITPMAGGGFAAPAPQFVPDPMASSSTQTPGAPSAADSLGDLIRAYNGQLWIRGDKRAQQQIPYLTSPKWDVLDPAYHWSVLNHPSRSGISWLDNQSGQGGI